MRYVITDTLDAHGLLAVRVECVGFAAIVSEPTTKPSPRVAIMQTAAQRAEWTRVRFERGAPPASVADEAEADLSALADAAMHVHALALG